MEGVQELPHHRDKGLQALFASCQELVIEGFDVGIPLDGDQGRHEEEAS